MPIQFDCECGKPFNVDAKHAGRKLRCPDCGETLTVPGARARSVESSGEGPSASRPAKKRPQKRRPAPVQEEEDYEEYEEYEDDDHAEPRRSSRSGGRSSGKGKSKSRGKSSGGAQKSTMSLILSGIGMTIGGVVWLLLGLNANLFYPYSVIVIIVGVVTFFVTVHGSELLLVQIGEIC